MKQFITCPQCGSIELAEIDVTNDSISTGRCSVCGYLIGNEIEPAKAISIKQPWAYLIASGIKDIENRTWKTNFRGRVLIHTGAKFDFDGFDWICTYWKELKLNKIFVDQRVLSPSRLTGFAIIGSIEIADCVQDYHSIWAEYLYEEKDWPEKFKWNWVLANPILFEKPILNVKGKLSYFVPEINDH